MLTVNSIVAVDKGNALVDVGATNPSIHRDMERHTFTGLIQ
jgi:hypothetical protein